MSNFEKVKKFMQAVSQETPDSPKWPDQNTLDLRESLQEEEHKEYKDAVRARNLKEVADAIVDQLYVIYGTGAAFGLPIDQMFDEVNRSNMSKLGEDGKPILSENGKVLKGPNYSPPNLSQFLAE